MEKKNVLRVGGGEATLRASVKTIEASPNGGTIEEFYIQSYREKLVNGKRTGEISAVNDVGSPDLLARDWLHYNYTRFITVDNIPVLDVSIRADKNTGSSSRSYDLEFTQNPSGKKVNVTVNQEPSVTLTDYTFFSDTQQQTFTFGYDENLTKSFIITSYAEYSDGSKLFMPINVSSLPPWITVTQTQDGVSNVYQRRITITLLANTGAQRNYAITFTQQNSASNFTLSMLQNPKPY